MQRNTAFAFLSAFIFIFSLLAGTPAALQAQKKAKTPNITGNWKIASIRMADEKGNVIDNPEFNEQVEMLNKMIGGMKLAFEFQPGGKLLMHEQGTVSEGSYEQNGHTVTFGDIKSDDKLTAFYHKDCKCMHVNLDGLADVPIPNLQYVLIKSKADKKKGK